MNCFGSCQLYISQYLSKTQLGMGNGFENGQFNFKPTILGFETPKFISRRFEICQNDWKTLNCVEKS